MNDDDDCIFVDEASTINGKEVKYSGEVELNANTYIWYVEYQNVIYKFNVIYDENIEICNTSATYGVKKVGSKISSTSTTTLEVGSTISYDNKEWMIMYVNETDIQMISKDALQYKGNYLYLGLYDTYLTENGTLQGSTDLEKSIYSYNNAITTLNSACEKIVNTEPSYVTGVRCVGSNPTNKSSESSNNYSSTWPCKDEDNNFETDCERLLQLGKHFANKEGTESKEGYWMASRLVEIDSDGVCFMIRGFCKDGYYVGNGVCCANNGHAHKSGNGDLLRPVVTIDTTKCTFSYDSTNSYFTINAK